MNKKKIGFFTGARSEYGIMKSFLKKIKDDPDLEYLLYVSGLHLLKKFGTTKNEIINDGFRVKTEIPVFDEISAPSYKEFAHLITVFSEILINDHPDVLLIVGDRIEAYSAAIACHFAKIPIIHLGGGNITEGANDNYYRYNITNLSSYHFATSKQNYNRILKLPIIKPENVFFTGSTAIDAILRFLNNPRPIKEFYPELDNKQYCLATFHPATASKEPIAEIMDKAIEFIHKQGFSVLITYPNNDEGFEQIIEIINKWQNHTGVVTVKNLGADLYYSALYSSSFVIGNSSSGLVEAPYFNKPVINIGTRQKGRETDTGVTSINCSDESLYSSLENGFSKNWPDVKGNNLFGDGNAAEKMTSILHNKILPDL